MFDKLESQQKKLEEDIPKSDNSSRAPLPPFYWSPNNRSPSRCSFDSSHLPWSYWTVCSTATVRRRRNAGGETKEVTWVCSLRSQSSIQRVTLKDGSDLVWDRGGNSLEQGCSHGLLKPYVVLRTQCTRSRREFERNLKCSTYYFFLCLIALKSTGELLV